MTQSVQLQGVEMEIRTDMIDGKPVVVGRYRDTNVCIMSENGTVTLNSGGFLTATTKLRMNQFSKEFCNGRFHVYQKAGNWFVGWWGSDCERDEPFYDGMKV